MVKNSETLKNALAESYASIMTGSLLHIFSGPIPATPEAAVDATSVLLVTISESDQGGGLNFAPSAAGGVIEKDPNQVWGGTVQNSGVPTFYRLCESSDDAMSENTSTLRLQGSVTVGGGGDLIVTRSILNSGEALAINFWSQSAINPQV